MITIPEQYETKQFRRAEIERVDERLIQLRAVPYDVETELAHGLWESFAPGAFAAQSKDPARVKLYLGHSDDGGQVVGHATQVEDRADGVHITAKVSATTAGNDLYELAQDGTLDEASIEFWPIADSMTVTRDGDQVHVRHRRGRLLGVALVPHGAYGRHALVASVREFRDRGREKCAADALARLAALNH